MGWLLLALLLLLFAWNLRERYTDGVVPPVLNSDGTIPSSWQSKIDAQTPIGDAAQDKVYFGIVQRFYTEVYTPKSTKPTDADVEAFLKKVDLAGVDTNAVRKLLAQGFQVESGVPAAAREQTQLVTAGALAGFAGKNLEPGNARDEVYDRTEQIYQPVDTRKGAELPEGLYAPVNQQDEPRNPGDSLPLFSSLLRSRYQVCDPASESCVKNVM